ncbi:hypothetical protein ACHAPX_007752 [Trichoderma viride]
MQVTPLRMTQQLDLQWCQFSVLRLLASMLGLEPSLLVLVSISESGNILLMILAYKKHSYIPDASHLISYGLKSSSQSRRRRRRFLFLVGTRVLPGGRLPETVLSYPITSRPTGAKVFSARVRSRNKAQPKISGMA